MSGISRIVDVARRMGFVKAPPGQVPVFASPSDQGIVIVGDGLKAVRSSHVRSAPIRVATFGNSKADVRAAQSPTSCDQTVVTAAFPASGQKTFLSHNAHRWALGQEYPLAYLVANGGIGSTTVASMLARDAAASGATRMAVGDVINLAPDVVFFRADPVNDFAAYTAATLTQAVIDTAYANVVTLINRFLVGVPFMIVEGFYGYSPSGTLADLDARRAALIQVESRVNDYCAANFASRIALIPSIGNFCDAAGNFDARYHDDGVHLNAQGQKRLAQLEAVVLSQIFGSCRPGPRYTGVNVLSNPLMHATGSVASGTAATGYTLGSGNATLANSKVEVINGQPWQTTEVTPTGADGSANASAYISYAFSPSALGILANDVYGFEFDFFISDLSGGAGIPLNTVSPNNLNAQLYFSKTAAGAIVLDAAMGNTTAGVAKYGGRAVFPPFKFPEDGAGLSASCLLLLQIVTQNARPFKLGFSAPRAVEL